MVSRHVGVGEVVGNDDDERQISVRVFHAGSRRVRGHGGLQDREQARTGTGPRQRRTRETPDTEEAASIQQIERSGDGRTSREAVVPILT